MTTLFVSNYPPLKPSTQSKLSRNRIPKASPSMTTIIAANNEGATIKQQHLDKTLPDWNEGDFEAH